MGRKSAIGTVVVLSGDRHSAIAERASSALESLLARKIDRASSAN